MARQLFAIALIFVVMNGMVMAQVASSVSPESLQIFVSAPKAATTAHKEATTAHKAATTAHKAATISPSTAPTSSPTASPLAPSLAPSTSNKEEGVSAPPAQASGPIELFAPGPEPVNDGLASADAPAADEATSGASAIQFSAVVSIIIVVSLFFF